ncbi:hypothetical protein GCM10009682_37940 [Luedemannella flava]|uniref:PH domain-containing protein n=1 Tax=Luedemannella flava TaxID=349316 RepID=A0ABN2M798_9ACTN
MSPTAIRWAAVPLGLLAFGLRVLAETWWSEVAFRSFDRSYYLLATLSGLLAAGAVPFGILLVLTRGDRRPAAFERRPGRLVAPTSPVFASGMAIMIMYLSAGLVNHGTVGRGDDRRVVVDLDHWTTVAVGVCWLFAVGFLLLRRPVAVLDAHGVTVKRLWTVNVLAWHDLLPGGPASPTRRRPASLRVYRNAAPVPGPYLPSVDIPVSLLHIDAAYLADTIRYHVDHPDERATIADPG